MATYFKRNFTKKDGTITTKWCGEHTYNNKTKTFYGKTKKEVQERIREFTTDKIMYGEELSKTSYNVSDWLYKHLFTNVYPNVASSTFDRYMCLWRKHIDGADFGNTLLIDVKQIKVQEFFNTKTDIANKALSMLRYLLKQSFDFAIVNNYVRVNPVVNIKLPKEAPTVNKHTIEVLTVEEQEKYIEALDHTKHKLLFLTALFTGMRRGEIIALKWDNVDLTNSIIHVRESRKRCKKYNADGTSLNVIFDKEPKTKNSNREIPIPDFLADMLNEHERSSEFVFVNRLGVPVNPEALRITQQALCKRANIRYVSFHALRHTFATRLIENGTDVKTVSKILGHSDILITLNTYVHETMDSKRCATTNLADMFRTVL